MHLVRALALAPLLVLVSACDSDGSTAGDATTSTSTSTSTSDTSTSGSLTGCALGFAVENATGKDFGQSCTADAECKYGECMMPGDPGNITNTKFGFCTRGCDCQGNTASQIPADQKEGILECVYPSDGAGGLKDYHFVAVECSDLAKCQGIDPQWTSCELPDTGSARKVCHAL